MVEHWAGLAMPQRKKASKGGSLTLQVLLDARAPFGL